MLFARSWRRQLRRVRRLKNQHLAESQVVVCKIRQPPLLITQALLPAILFHLLRMILAISLPVVRVCFAPLPRTLQADLLIHRIGSNFLTMIIGAALALARRLAANPLLWMIRVRLKNLLTVGAAVILHQASPEENGRSSFSLEAPLNLNASAKKLNAYRNYRGFHRVSSRCGCCCFSLPSTDSTASSFDRSIWPRMMSRLCGAVSPAKSPDLSAKNRDRRLGGSAAPRNNTLRIRAEVRGVRAADNLESLECVHFGIQRTGPHSPVQGDSQARRVPGGSILPVVLTAWGGTGSRS